MDLQDVPFGGKVLILAGDFRQCLPVIKNLNAAGIAQQCINSSNLWTKFQIKRLTTNMRVRALEDPHL